MQAARRHNSNAVEGGSSDSQAATPAAGTICSPAVMHANASSNLEQQAAGREADRATYAAGQKGTDAQQSSISSRKASGRFHVLEAASITASATAPASAPGNTPLTNSNSLSRGSSTWDGQQPPVATAAAGVVDEVRRAGLVASSSLVERAAAAIALLEAVGSASSMVSGLTDIAAPASSAVSGNAALGGRSDTADATSPSDARSKT